MKKGFFLVNSVFFPIDRTLHTDGLMSDFLTTLFGYAWFTRAHTKDTSTVSEHQGESEEEEDDWDGTVTQDIIAAGNVLFGIGAVLFVLDVLWRRRLRFGQK